MNTAYETAMRVALDHAKLASASGDVPVGAVVLHKNEIIAARHNEREVLSDPTAHAEVLALRDAAAVLGTWHLDECTLVVTLEPCMMCAGALINARIHTLVFAAIGISSSVLMFDIVNTLLYNIHWHPTAGPNSLQWV